MDFKCTRDPKLGSGSVRLLQGLKLVCLSVCFEYCMLCVLDNVEIEVSF